MTKICTQTNVAEVDNSAVACEKFISTDCIIHEAAISYLALPENSPVTDVVENLLLSLIDARNRVTVLEGKPAKLINVQTGTVYTVVESDAQNRVSFNNAAPVALTVPADLDLDFDIGTEIELLNLGAGTVTIAGVGVTFIENIGLTIPQGASRAIIKVAANTWMVKY